MSRLGIGIGNNKPVPRTEVVRSGLILYLDGRDFLNSPSTSPWLDKSGKGHNGTPSGLAYTISSGSDGLGGVAFDGVDDSINCGTSADFLNLSTITMEAKCSPGLLNGTEQHVLSNVEASGFDIYISTSNKFSAAVYVGGSYRIAVSNIVPTVGQVYHVIGRYDGSQVSLWINGVKQTTTSAITGSIVNSPTYVAVGQNPPVGGYLTGKVYTARLYNRALSDAEILQNYNASLI